MRLKNLLYQRAVEEQQFNLREGAEIVIATPGRLKDVIERHVLVLSQCRYVVMDEADRMVHLGFENDLTFILDALPSGTMEGEDQGDYMDVDGETLVKKGRTRVTTLFSATMPPAVERLAKKYLKKPAVITIGEAGRAVDTVEQKVEFVNGDEKKKCVFSSFYFPFLHCSMSDGFVFYRQKLLEILNKGGYQPPIIVFVNQKKTADMVAKDLQKAGVRLSIFTFFLSFVHYLTNATSSGARLHYTRARIKNRERPRCNPCAMANQTSSLRRILQVVVLMYKMSVLSSTSRWLVPLKPTSIVSVCVFEDFFVLALVNFQ